VTVTGNVQDAVCVAVAAVQRTVVVPTGNNDEEGGVHVTVASDTPFAPTGPPVAAGFG
jgi:hypothetical protein